jgi:hypothetical protein
VSVAAILALALQAAAPAWQSLGTHGGIDTAYDPASVQPAGERRIRVRVRGIVATPGPDEIKTATGLLEIDCAAGTATPIEVRGTDATGGLVLNALIPPAERRPEPIRPASPNAAVRDAVCGGASGQR